MTTRKTEPRTLSNYCNSCQNTTFHFILHKEENKGNSDFYFSDEYMIVRCKGCNALSFRREYVDDNFTPNSYDDNYIHPDIQTFPEVIISKSSIEGYIHILPRTVKSFYIEATKAISYNLKRLAAAGFRAVIEAICLEKGIEGKNLDTKINNLQKGGYITKADRDRLHSIRFIGNDSIHEMKTPTDSQLLVVLKIIDNVINSIYIMDEIANQELLTPIKDFADFESILNSGIAVKNIGDTLTLKNILPEAKHLINDDIASFEKQLIEKIDKGEYTKLSLSRSSTARVQQYKVESL